jgi:RES domain-containing protein
VYLWRISNHADLSGRGGLLASGRWHHRGNPVVYCSDHPSTALLEILVHVDLEDLPSQYTLLKIFCPDDLSLQKIENGEPSSDDAASTQDIGTRLLQAADFCLIDVPSIVMPQARNILINPKHVRSEQIAIETVFHYPFDSRLLR